MGLEGLALTAFNQELQQILKDVPKEAVGKLQAELVHVAETAGVDAARSVAKEIGGRATELAQQHKQFILSCAGTAAQFAALVPSCMQADAALTQAEVAKGRFENGKHQQETLGQFNKAVNP